MIYLTMEERTHHIKSSKMAYGRKPTWISGPDQNGIMVLHVVGSLKYTDAGNTYAPSRFIVVKVDQARYQWDGVIEYDLVVLVEIAGIPKKPSKRRAL